MYLKRGRKWEPGSALAFCPPLGSPRSGNRFLEGEVSSRDRPRQLGRNRDEPAALEARSSLDLPDLTGRGTDLEGGLHTSARRPRDVDRRIDVRLRRSVGRPRLVDDLDTETVSRQGVQDAVAVCGIPVADPDPNLRRGERPDRLAPMEPEGLGARGDPRVDHLSIPNHGDAWLPARIDADEQLAPERFRSEERRVGKDG